MVAMPETRVGSISLRILLCGGVALLAIIGITLLFLDFGNAGLSGTDLSHLQATAVPEHIAGLQSPDAAMRKRAALLLWQMGDLAREATPALLTAAKDSDAGVREAALKALGRTGQDAPDAVAAEIAGLADQDAAVRAAAATALAETWRQSGQGQAADRRTGPMPGAPGRLAAANPAQPRADRSGNPPGDGSPPSARPGRPKIRLLPTYADQAAKAVPALRAALHDRDALVRAAAAQALAETGALAAPAVPDLIAIVEKDADAPARLQATLALGNIGESAKDAVPVLVERLRRETEIGLRVNTAIALGQIRAAKEMVVPALVEFFLTVNDPDGRIAAMMSIGEYGAEAALAIPLLENAAKDPKNQPKAMQESIARLLKFLRERSAAAAPAEKPKGGSSGTGAGTP